MSFAPYSFTAQATIGAYHIVKLGTAANSVVIAGGATDKPLGVTTDESTQASEEIPVAVAGIAKVQFNDTAALGDLVTSDASGLGVKAVATTAGVQVLGILIGSAVSATGTIADVLIQPYQLQAQ